MTDEERLLAGVLEAGDILADMLGIAMAAVDWGEDWCQEQFEAGYDAVVAWHNVHAIAVEEILDAG